MIHLVTAANDQYARHLGVMLESLLCNNTSTRVINIYILYDDLSQKNRGNLRQIVKKYNQKLHFISMANSDYDKYKVTEYITKEMYYRISIPDIVSQEINKVLYLDCDLIIKKDIKELWDTNINDHFLAAVESVYADERVADLSIPHPSDYFNSGVLLLNLTKWRKHDISNKVMDYIKNNPTKLVHPDQDALNAVLYDKWLPLEPKWNFTTGHIERLHLEITPSIIHFTGKRKPWNVGHPLQAEYFKYLQKINWQQ